MIRREIFWEYSPDTDSPQRPQRERSRSRANAAETRAKASAGSVTTAKAFRKGQLLCGDYNSAKGCSGNCNMLHVCNAVQKSGRICGGKGHTSMNCPNRKVQGGR